MIKRFIRSALLALAFVSPLKAQEMPTEINFGIISTESAQNVRKDWEPFLADMQKRIGVKINAFFAQMDTDNRRASTLATAIEINRPVNLMKCLRALETCDGVVREVSDELILAAKAQIGAGGFGCEPASAASVAGLLKRKEEVPASATVVCVLTGNGLKDPTTAIEHNDSKFHTGLEPDTATVARVMGF